jgi:hypothetical protein
MATHEEVVCLIVPFLSLCGAYVLMIQTGFRKTSLDDHVTITPTRPATYGCSIQYGGRFNYDATENKQKFQYDGKLSIVPGCVAVDYAQVAMHLDLNTGLIVTVQ